MFFTNISRLGTFKEILDSFWIFGDICNRRMVLYCGQDDDFYALTTMTQMKLILLNNYLPSWLRGTGSRLFSIVEI